ncbi:hypothetical protein FKW77_007395 [Venturia effusa]|uniref:Inositol-1-monophosphatase n=1 Tax=Venturia effusa TaxID=50376 RepID=A0A517L7M6_9PEZI|nr:hypothetical protein FKW77_007395 [Venturia effusa]
MSTSTTTPFNLSSSTSPNVESPASSIGDAPGSPFDPSDLGARLLLSDTKHLEEVHDFLVSIAHEGGKIMLEADIYAIESDTKNNTCDRVTAYDKAIEAMVKTKLAKKFPDYRFLGEETGGDKQKLTNEPTFVCDPIDGTLNFTCGFPNVAISLALTVDMKPVVGVVFNPFRSEMFTAIQGQGAFFSRNGGPKQALPLNKNPKPFSKLQDCLVAVEWGNERKGDNWALRTSVHRKLLTDKIEDGAMVKSVRSNGSAALDFCYVATGWYDMFWEGGVWIWDVCAGWIIVEEAGGIVAGANPNEWNPTLEGRSYLPVRAGAGQKQVIEELWGLMEGKSFVYPSKK